MLVSPRRNIVTQSLKLAALRRNLRDGKCFLACSDISGNVVKIGECWAAMVTVVLLGSKCANLPLRSFILATRALISVSLECKVGLMLILLVPRSNTLTPSQSSKLLIRLEKAGCVIFLRAAARVMLPSSKRIKTSSNQFISILLLLLIQ